MSDGTDTLLEIGGKFGIYDVVRELGHGGMGAVYLVRDPRDGTELAAKVMYPESAAVRDYFVKRFIREAEIAMTVRHPNLIRVYDVGCDPDTGLGYMLMEYVPGGSLKDRLTRRLVEGDGPFAVMEALHIVRQVAEALDAAASHGVVHRDVKPDNILFGRDGVAKLADLGVAKVSDSDASTLLTMSNVVVGTPAYMAPEQMTNSHAVDARADVYSLGIVLWEILAGERPTAGASAAELMARAVRKERIPDIRTVRKGLPPYVLELLRSMTEPNVDKRLESPKAIIRFLAEWKERERRRMLLLMAGFVAAGCTFLLSAVGGGIWYMSAKPQEDLSKIENLEVKTVSLPTIAELESEISKGTSEDELPATQKPPAENVKSDDPVATTRDPQVVGPAAADSASGAVETPEQEGRASEDWLEGLVKEFASIASDANEGMRRLNETVNEARRIDRDLLSFDLFGKPKQEGGRPLSASDTETYRKGVVFLQLELFRRKHSRIPNAEELRAILDI